MYYLCENLYHMQGYKYHIQGYKYRIQSCTKEFEYITVNMHLSYVKFYSTFAIGKDFLRFAGI